MRVLIDGMNLALEQGTGVATYARNLSLGLTEAGHDVSTLYGRNVTPHRAPVLREAAFFNAGENRGRKPARQAWDLIRSLAPVSAYAVPETGFVLRDELKPRLPVCRALLNHPGLFLKALSKFKSGLGFLEVTLPEPVDVAHWTYPLPLRVRGARNVYTIHDLVPLRLPYATLDRKPLYHRLMRAIARTADAVVTVSETSRRDILALLPVAPERVVNTFQSVAIRPSLLAAPEADLDAALAAVSEMAQAMRPAGLLNEPPVRLERRGFLLFLGAVEPKKNLLRLVQAYLASGVPQPLVVVGRRAWQFEETMRLVEKSPRILYLDYLPFAQVVMLMRAARATLFPSLYEGFGLPVLESFLCGTPVVTSAVGATAEVAGDAALLVDAYDPASIRDAIRAVAADDALCADLAARGAARARAFAPAEVVPRLTAVYEAVVAGRPVA